MKSTTNTMGREIPVIARLMDSYSQYWHYVMLVLFVLGIFVDRSN